MANELKINLIVNDDGTAVIKNFSDSTVKHLKKVEDAGIGMEKSFAKTWQGMAVGANQAMSLLQQVVGIVTAPIQAFAESETAAMKMGMALKNQGDFSSAALADMKEFAEQLQKTTAYEDDATLAVMANMKSYGMSNEQVKEATKVALDLATAKAGEGMSVERASEIMGKSYLGIATGLKKIGIQIDETAPKGELFNSVMKQVEARFGGSAQAELTTYAGQWKHIKNQWQDVQEFLGYTFLKTIEFLSVGVGHLGQMFLGVGETTIFILRGVMSPLTYLADGLAKLNEMTGNMEAAKGLRAFSGALANAQDYLQSTRKDVEKWTEKNVEAWMTIEKVSAAIEKMGGQGGKTKPILDDVTKGLAKSTSEMYKAMEQEAKASYEMTMKSAEAAAKAAQDAGQDELKTIQDQFTSQSDAAYDLYSKRYDLAWKEVQNENRTAKAGYDAVAAFNAKESALNMEYEKTWSEFQNQKTQKTSEYAKKNIDVMASLYRTIDQYSDDSVSSQIAQMEKKYKEDGRWATATKEQRKILEAALGSEILRLKTNNMLALRNLDLAYLETISGPYTAAYKATFSKTLELQATLLAEQMKSAGVAFDKEAWLTNKIIEEDAKRLEAKAAYYAAIGGMEDKAMAASIAAIEMREKLNTLYFGDEAAALAQSKQDTMKVQQDIISGIESRYETEHKYQKQTITNAMSVADNAMAMMDKESKGYQLMQDAKKVLQIAEIAMTIQKNLAVLAGIPAQQAQAVATGATATLNAGASGDGYTAIARVAAMMAIVASVLAAAGIAFGGGGSSASSSAPATPAMGNSTVLGAAYGTGSESVANSMKLLENTYNMENTKLTKIYEELRDLNSNITGLVSSLIRTGSLGTGIPVDLSGSKGWAQSQWDNAANSTIGGIFTGHLLTDAVFGENSKIGGFLTKLSDVFTGWFSSTLGAIFGGGQETNLTATGISIGQSIVKNIMAGANTSIQQYATTHTHEDGGWFSSDSDWDTTYYAAVDRQVTDLFTKVYKSLGSALVDMATMLGADTQSALNYAFGAASMNLLGMSGEQISKAISTYISNIGDTAVQALFGGILSQYQKLNEGLMETATRIIQDKAIVAEVMDMTGQSLTGTTAQAIAFSESLISIAGSLENLTDAASSFVDKFYTDAEKQARLYNNLTAVMSQHSLGLPGTREAYRGIVESLDLTTEAGKRAYVSLLSLADSADTYYTYIEELADKRAEIELRLLGLTSTAAELLAVKRQKELEAMDASLRPLQSLIYLYEDLATAQATTSSAIDKQISAANTMASAARSAASAYKNITESLQTAIDKISGATAENSSTKFYSTYAQAMTGNQDALSALPGLADSLLATSLASASTADEYAIAQGKILIALAEAKNVSIGMTNWEEYQATLLEAQVATLTAIKEELSQPGPDTVLLTQQAGILTNIATLLQQQTTQIVSGNNLTTTILQDQTGKIVAGNSLSASQITLSIGDYLTSVKNSIVGSSSADAQAARAAIATLQQVTADGLLKASEAAATLNALSALKAATTSLLNAGIAVDQQAMSSAAAKAEAALNALTAQTGTIASGNTLTSNQTAQVITGNATSDAIKNISNLNTAYSQEMLKALVVGETSQSNNLAGVLAANNKTVSLLGQLVDMYRATTQAAADASAQQAAAAVAAAAANQAALEKAAADKVAAEAAAKLAETIATATAAYNTQKSVAESYRSQWDQFATANASASFKETQENINVGQKYSVTGYYSYSDAERAWLSSTSSAYSTEFAKAFALWQAIPGHATGLDRVPYDDYLMRAHKDESVLSATEATEWRNSKTGRSLHTSSNVAVVEELRALRQDFKDLKAGIYEITKNTLKTAKVLSNATDGALDSNGMPAIRTAA